MKEKLTHSRMACLKDCPRKHYWRYEMCIAPANEGEALRIGSMVHDGLDKREIPKKAPYPNWAIGDDDARTAWDIEWAKSAALLQGYFEYWKDDACEELASELSFEMKILNPETGGTARNTMAAGKIDKIVKHEGEVMLMEHKTTGKSLEPDSDYWKRLKLDQQISLYWIAAVDMGHDICDILYDVIRKPGIKPKKVPDLDDDGEKIVVGKETRKRVFKDDGTPRLSAGKDMEVLSHVETPEEYGARLVADIADRPEFYFARRNIPRLQADLDEFETELWQQHEALSIMRRTNRWYRNTNMCLSTYRCEYLDVCHMGHKIEDGVPDGFMQVKKHPELI